MWSLDEIVVEIVEAEGPIVAVEITTPVGRLEMLGAIHRVGRLLHCKGVHIDGLRPGALGRSGLNAIGRKLLAEADVDEIVIEGGARSTGRTRGRVPRQIRFPR